MGHLVNFTIYFICFFVPGLMALSYVHIQERVIISLNFVIIKVFFWTQALVKLKVLDLNFLLFLGVVIVGLLNGKLFPTQSSFSLLDLLSIR
jgi:hypothetical protein